MLTTLMKKMLIFFLLILSIPVMVSAATDQKLIPYRIGDLWGFANELGEVQIAPEFDSVRFFSANRAVVGLHGKFGYIDRQGNLITKIKYVEAFDFDALNEWAEVIVRNKKHKINLFGKRIKPLSFMSVIRCGWGEGMNWNFDPKHLYYYQDGKVGLKQWFRAKTTRPDTCFRYLPLEYDAILGVGDLLVALKKDSKWGLFDIRLYPIHPFVLDDIIPHPTNHPANYAIIRIGRKYGFMNFYGKITLWPKYEQVDFFENGLAKAWVGGKWGYINESGLEYFEREL